MEQYFDAINANLIPNITTSKGQITFFWSLKCHIQMLTSGGDGGEEEEVREDEERDAGNEQIERDFHMQLCSHGAIESATTTAPTTTQQERQTSMGRKASTSVAHEHHICILLSFYML